MEQVKLEEFDLKGMKFTAVKQCFFHACNKSNNLQLLPEAVLILQLLRCLGNVTSCNIRQIASVV